MIDMVTSYGVVKPYFTLCMGMTPRNLEKVKSASVELSPGSTDPDYIDPSEGWPSALNCHKIEKSRSCGLYSVVREFWTGPAARGGAMNRYAAWLTIAALCGGVSIAYAQLTSGIETIPCPLAFETSSLGGSGTVPAANAYQNLGNNPGIASNPPLTSPLGNNGVSNAGTAVNPGLTNVPQQRNTTLLFTPNAASSALAQPGPGTGSSLGTPLQFTPGTGFTPGTTIIGGNGINFGSGITPGVGLSSNGIAQSNGYNPGSSISPAATGAKTGSGFGVTC
jgi:hypothetical protein